MIDPTLFSPDIVFGGKNPALQVEAGQLKMVSQRPKQTIIPQLQALFQDQGPALANALRQHSFREITDFVTTICYLVEKHPNKVVRNKCNSECRMLLVHVAACCAIVAGLVIMVVNRFDPDPNSTQAYNRVGGFFLAYVGALLWILFGRNRAAGRPLPGRAVVGPQLHASICKVVYPIAREKALAERLSFPPSIYSYQAAIERRAYSWACIDHLWPSIWGKRQIRSDKNATKLTYRRFLDLRSDMIERQRYVVTTGTSRQGAFLIEFLTELARRLEPHRPLDRFKMLRFSLLSTQELPIEQLNVTRYLQKYPKADDRILTDDMGSFSINPWDYRSWESTLYFWSQGTSVKSNFAELAIKALHLQGRLNLSDAVKKDITECFEGNQPKTSFLKKGFTNLLQMTCNLFSCQPSSRGGDFHALSCQRALVDDRDTNPIFESSVKGLPAHPTDVQEVVHSLRRPWLTTQPCQGRILSAHIVPEEMEITRFNAYGADPETDRKVKALVEKILPKILWTPVSIPKAISNAAQALSTLSAAMRRERKPIPSPFEKLLSTDFH